MFNVEGWVSGPELAAAWPHVDPLSADRAGAAAKAVERFAAELEAEQSRDPLTHLVERRRGHATRFSPLAVEPRSGLTVGELIAISQNSQRKTLYGVDVGRCDLTRLRPTSGYSVVQVKALAAIAAVGVLDSLSASGTLTREQRDDALRVALAGIVERWRGVCPKLRLAPTSCTRQVQTWRREIRRGVLPFVDQGRPRSHWQPPEYAAALFLSIAQDRNGHKIIVAIDAARDLMKARGERPPSAATWRRWARSALPPAVRAYLLAGEREAPRLLPHGRRPNRELEPYAVVEADGRKRDQQYRRRRMDGGWERTRTVTAVYLVDRATGFVPGWDLRFNESRFGMLGAIAMSLREYGRFGKLVTDNGSGFTAALFGGVDPNRDKSPIGTFFGFDVEQLPPYTPERKGLAERTSGLLGELERESPAYWGASPASRPADRDRETRENVMSLATVDDARAEFAELIRRHNNTPVQSLGGRTRAEAFAARRHVERFDPELVDAMCTWRSPTPKKYGRDGIVCGRWLYRAADERLHWELNGTLVHTREHPDRVDFIYLELPDAKCGSWVQAFTPVARGERVARDEYQALTSYVKRCRRVAKEYRVSASASLESDRALLARFRAAQLAEREAQARAVAGGAEVTVVGIGSGPTWLAPRTSDAPSGPRKRERSGFATLATAEAAAADDRGADARRRLREIGERERATRAAERDASDARLARVDWRAFADAAPDRDVDADDIGALYAEYHRLDSEAGGGAA